MFWGAFKTALRRGHLVLHNISRVYPPAKAFLGNVETTLHRYKADVTAPAEVKLQKLLQQVWTPSTPLEGLVSSALLLCCHVHSYRSLQLEYLQPLRML